MDTQTFLFVIEMIGTIAAAISGIRMAAARRFDWFGAYSVGLVTAIGGGTLRDLLLGIPVFWMQSWWYILVTFISLGTVILFKHILVHTRILFVFDTIGLALFVVIGIQKSLAVDYAMWVAITMGIVTGATGGVARDILLNHEPLLFKKDFYASACLLGGLVYWLAKACGCSLPLCGMLCAATVIIARLLAVHYSWHLPQLQSDTSDIENQ